MSQLGAILRAKARMTRHRVASVRQESKLKVVVVSVSALLLWIGAFLLASWIFRWLQDLGGELLGGLALRLGDLLLGRLLSVFTLALLVMLFFSNLLISFATFFRAQEVGYLVQSPLPWRTLFLARFYESVIFSSWASAFLGSPVLLAYGAAHGSPPAFYLAGAALYVPFVTIPAAAGALVTLMATPWLARRSKGQLAAGGAVVAAGLFFVFRDRVAAGDLSATATLQTLIEAVGRPHSAWLPSVWLCEGVFAAGRGELGTTLFDFALLVANAALLVWLATVVADRFYFRGWSALAGDRAPGRRQAGRGPLAAVERWLGGHRGPVRALLVKDLRTFWRDPAQWSQFAIFFGLMTLYVANMRRTSAAYEPEVWQGWITLLNVAVCLLILATLTTRFVFPLVSLEGRRWWILGLAPVTMGQVVRQKFWLSLGTTSMFTLGLVVLSSYRLQLSPGAFLVSLFAIVAGNVALSGLAVGLGSLYPNFEEDNPARIVSGLGGTLNFILSMVYVVLVAAALVVLLQEGPAIELLGAGLQRWVARGALVFTAALTALACWLPLRLGLRHLQRLEL